MKKNIIIEDERRRSSEEEREREEMENAETQRRGSGIESVYLAASGMKMCEEEVTQTVMKPAS